MNSYARLADLKDDSDMGAHRDSSLLRAAEDASRAVDNYTGRRFYAEPGERAFDGRGHPDLWIDDAVSIESIAFGSTVLDSEGWYAWPANPGHGPIMRVSARAGAWPRGTQNIRITGVWGYSYERTRVGMLASDLDDASTTIEMADAGHVSAGDTLIVGDEQLDVLAVDDGSVSVERGINATEAAPHASGSLVFRRRFPRPIERATKMQAMRMLTAQQTGYADQVGDPQYGGFAYNSVFPQIRDMLAPYRLVTVA